MGRAGAGTGAAGRALSPLRSRLRPPGLQRTYLSISHLRSLHLELVELLDSAGAAALTSFPTDGATLSKKQGRRLVEILRSIAELVRDEPLLNFPHHTNNNEQQQYQRVHVLHTRSCMTDLIQLQRRRGRMLFKYAAVCSIDRKAAISSQCPLTVVSRSIALGMTSVRVNSSPTFGLRSTETSLADVM